MDGQAWFLIILPVLGLTSCHQSAPSASGTGVGEATRAPSATGVNAATSNRPLPDLPGITSTKDLASGLVALKPADVQFYIKNMQASLDRYQHPTPKDLADIAEAKRLLQAQALASSKMAEDYQAGNMQRAMNEDVLKLTPEQQATLSRGTALSSYGVAEMLAMDAGMPGAQWSMLCQDVEYAAGVNAGMGGGGFDESMSKVTAEQLAYAANRRRIAAANQALVAPSAPEIKRLQSLVMQLASDRAQTYMSP